MYKYIPVLALALCGCSHYGPEVSSTPAAQPAVVPVATVLSEEVNKDTPKTVTQVELSNNRLALVMRCSDQVDCFQKLTGYCPNGYAGGQMLTAGESKTVGVLFKCISDEEKAAQEKANAEEKAEEEAAREEIRRRIQEAAQHPTTKKK